jgi:PilZ domain
MTMDLGIQQMNERRRTESAKARASSRIRIQVPVFLRASDSTGSEFIELTKTLNISARGACITSSHLLRLGQTVHLTIPAPSASSSSLVPNETPPITARVRRQESLGDMRVFGLEFLRALE